MAIKARIHAAAVARPGLADHLEDLVGEHHGPAANAEFLSNVGGLTSPFPIAGAKRSDEVQGLHLSPLVQDQPYRWGGIQAAGQ